MAILNYSTTVSVERTMGQVQSLLVAAGARAVLAEYTADGSVTGMAFRYETPHGLHSYALPVNASKVEAVLRKQKVAPKFKTPEQAQRVAWRILKDWLEAQVAILQTEMVSFDQVMLPYQQGADGRTVYDLYLDSQLAIGPAEA